MVEITCPQCNYTKSIPIEKIPPGARWIKCPKCGNRFEYLKKEEDVETEKEFVMANSGLLKPFGGVSISRSLPIIFLIFIFLSPLLVSISIFISSLIIHFLLLLVRAGNNRFEATLRVMAYSQATRIWSILPFIGSLIGWVWRSIVQIIGLKSIPIVLLLLIAVGAVFFILRAISL
jgi:predicted Zn finger-like uncharacterized protein